jgi:uncharacterized protein YdeI (YjbR/CyaY-like superfamily)
VKAREPRSRKSKPSSKVLAPRFFRRPADFRKWLLANHETATELLVGLHKRDSGHQSITWPESVAEALCFGWIDGVRNSIDDSSYTIRFTPRKSSSIWSSVNSKKMEELIADCRVHPAGMRAFARRSAEKSAIYAYENRHSAVLDAASERELRRNRGAWKFFESCPPWYRRTAIWRIISAKRPETRARRLAELIACCAEGKSIPTLRLSRSATDR